MKKNLLIAVWVTIAVCACYDSYNPYDNEVVISKDCTTGSEKAGFKFDSDSVRCGRKSDVYFGLGEIDESMLFSPLGFYLFHDSGSISTLDSIWILETDPVKISICEKLNIGQMSLSGAFCLHKFDNTVKRESVNYYFNSEDNDRGYYFIYSKHAAYKAFCNVEAIDCYLRYSCVVQYSGTYDFSKIPNADDAERKLIGCAE